MRNSHYRPQMAMTFQISKRTGVVGEAPEIYCEVIHRSASASVECERKSADEHVIADRTDVDINTVPVIKRPRDMLVHVQDHIAAWFWAWHIACRSGHEHVERVPGVSQPVA